MTLLVHLLLLLAFYSLLTLLIIGLTRIHHPETPTLIGLSSGATGTAKGGLTVGVAWTKGIYSISIFLFFSNIIMYYVGGVSEALSQFGTRSIVSTTLGSVTTSPSSVSFTITYAINGSTLGVTQVAESYLLFIMCNYFLFMIVCFI